MNRQKSIDYKKDFKPLYLPPQKPVILDIPPIVFAAIEGEGDPNGEGFAQDTAALYSFSYAVKMSYKSQQVPPDYYEYTVFPLEGEWDLVDYTKPLSDKSNFSYQIMIRQPDFLTPALFELFLAQTIRKNPNPSLQKLKRIEINEGICCQMMHVGPYAEEPQSFARMEQFCQEQGWHRQAKTHREIYLSDPRKTDPAKMKTVLRFKISR